MATMLKSTKNVNLIEFKNGVKTEKISDTVLIMQSIIPYSIRDELNVSSSTRLVFWTLFHYNLIPSFIPINGLRNIHHNSKIFKKTDYYFPRRQVIVSIFKNTHFYVSRIHICTV